MKIALLSIETDETGAFKEIKNWKQVREQGLSRSRKLIDMSTDLPSQQKERMFQTIKSSMESKEKCQILFSKDFQTLFQGFGYLYDVSDTMEYEMELPNPVGAKSFTKYGKIYFDTGGVDSSNSIVMYNNGFLDPEETSKSLRESLAKMAPAGANVEEAMKDILYNIKDEMFWQYDLSTGAILKASSERTLLLNTPQKNSSTIDRKQFTLLEIH